MSTTGKRHIVIVGAGAAGCAVADTLRRNGFGGVVTILDEDSHAPYDRPPLSKAVLSDANPDLEKIRFPTHVDLIGSGVQMELGVKIVSCDLAERYVVAEDGRTWEFDELVVATGVTPRRLPTLASERVLTLRTWRDAQALRDSVHRGDSIVVVGAGFLGLEVAATARKLGCAVVVLSAAQRPLEDRLGSIVAQRLIDEHHKRGVAIIGGKFIQEVRSADASAAHALEVLIEEDDPLACDTVVVAIGSEPRTEWLEGSGLVIDGGIRCDDLGRAGEGVWAVGDVAQWHNPQTGTWVRHEHRSSANEQGIAVGHALLEKQPPVKRSAFFWTDQYDVKVQVWGSMPASGVTTFLAGCPDDDSFVLGVAERVGEEPAAVIAWNATRAALPHRAALDRRAISAGAVGKLS